MIFVDTSAWFSAYVPSDPLHYRVQQLLSVSDRIVTSDYVLDETVTLLKAHGHVDRALHFGPRLLEGRAAIFEYLQPHDIEQAWIVFSQYRDKEWSFTDCTSFVLMKRLSIVNVVTLDNHFREMSGIMVADLSA